MESFLAGMEVVWNSGKSVDPLVRLVCGLIFPHNNLRVRIFLDIDANSEEVVVLTDHLSEGPRTGGHRLIEGVSINVVRAEQELDNFLQSKMRVWGQFTSTSIEIVLVFGELITFHHVFVVSLFKFHYWPGCIAIVSGKAFGRYF